MQTAKFRQFWDETAKARHTLDRVPGFEQAIRNYAIHVLSHLPKASTIFSCRGTLSHLPKASTICSYPHCHMLFN